MRLHLLTFLQDSVFQNPNRRTEFPKMLDNPAADYDPVREVDPLP